jgi:flagellar hook-associated protein 2
MAGLALSGLASGVDTATVVEQLMAIERQSSLRLQLKQKQAQARQDALKDVSTRLKNLNTAATDLRSSLIWADTQTVESSDSTKVTAKRVSGAGPGSYSLQVLQLARAEQRTYDYTPNAGAATTLSVGAKTFNLAAGATLADVVSQINSDATSPVYAAAVDHDSDGDQELVLSSRSTGSAAGFTASGSTVAEVAGTQKLGLNAQFTVDNGAVLTATTNTVSNAVPGLELTLKGASTVNITVGAPGADTAAVKAKVKAFVDQYNSTVDFIKGKLNEKKVPNATTDADSLKGLLKGDTMLNSVLSQLRVGLTASQAGNPSTMDELAELGVSTGATTGESALNANAVAGKLVFDEKIFDAAMASNPLDVRRMLGGMTGTSGFGQAVEAILQPSVSSTGTMQSRINAMDDEKKRITDSIAAMDKRLSAKEARLKATFAAMESAMSASQQQSSWLSGQLAALNNNR